VQPLHSSDTIVLNEQDLAHSFKGGSETEIH
jgi:hypothetical protein